MSNRLKIKLLTIFVCFLILAIVPNQSYLFSKKFYFSPYQVTGANSPKITGVTPNKFSLAGNVEIVVEGENFSANSLVVLGDQVISNTTISEKEIKFLAPSQDLAGNVTLSIQNANGLAQTELQALAKNTNELQAGEITTLLATKAALGNGQLASKISLSTSTKIAVDKNGNIFIADKINHQVRFIDAKTGIINLVAGMGVAGFAGDGQLALTAKLNSPTDVALDNDGNIFILDSGNLRIRKIDNQTGIITTFAGNGTFGCSIAFCGVFGNGGPATEASIVAEAISVDSLGNLFLIESGSGFNCIRKIDAQTGIITGFVGVCSKEIFMPCDVEDEEDCMFFIDIASDKAGNLFVINSRNDSIDKIDSTTRERTILQRYDRFNNRIPRLSSIAVDQEGNILLATIKNTIIKLDGKTGEMLSTIAGNGKPGFSGDGNLATEASFNFLDIFLEEEVSLDVDSVGNIFISDVGNNRIRKISASTNIVETTAGLDQVITEPAENTFLNLSYIKVKNGKLYTSDFFSNSVKALDLNTGQITLIAGNGQDAFAGDGGLATQASLSFPQGLAINNRGDVFISDSDNGRVRKVDAQTGIITTFAGNGEFSGAAKDGVLATETRLFEPLDLTFDLAGNLLILDGRVIRKVDAKTNIINTIAGGGNSSSDGVLALEASLNDPVSIAVNSVGDVFVASFGDKKVRQIDVQTGIITTFAGNGETQFNGEAILATQANLGVPTGIAFDEQDNLFISDTFNNRIRKVDTQTGIITTVVGNGSLGYSGDNDSAIGASLENPGIIAYDKGKLFICDQVINPSSSALFFGEFNRVVRVAKIGAEDDFGLFITESPNIFLSQQNRKKFVVNINKLGIFDSDVTITPPQNLPLGISFLPAKAIKTSTSANFKIKITEEFPCGDSKFTFVGQDSKGRKRNVELSLILQRQDCIR
ncbi:MAG: IPT/TIG domain-containing protein [Acidobacteria bacterium]|nr:IPT/TIG domain-containing protein [Acidobacteriota bacterium]